VKRLRAVLTKAAIGLTSLALAFGGLVGLKATVFSERNVWFDRLITLAQSADAAYDQLDPVWSARPLTKTGLWILVKEIVFQIEEEGASLQIVRPTNLQLIDYGKGRRSAVAGTYYPSLGLVAINERFYTPAWGDQNYLGVLVHEIVHAQGYFVGPSATLESQTEIVSKEVLAAMANLGYPGARADFLDDLRRNALSMAYYIARFGGSPIHTTYNEHAPATNRQADAGMLERLGAARKSIFTAEELARADHRLRWWEQHSYEFEEVLAKYVVTTVTMELEAGCSDNYEMAESFQQYGFYGYGDFGLRWGENPVTLPPLVMDDFGYFLRELNFC
jgi:hypothetical protein